MVHYPEAGHNGKSITILGRDYFGDLYDEHVNVREFTHALKEVRKSCAFYPKVKDFLDAIKSFRESPAYAQEKNVIMIEEHDSGPRTPEEIERCERRVGCIIKLAAGQMSLDEALGEMKPITDFKGGMEK